MDHRRKLALMALFAAATARAADKGSISGTVDRPKDVTTVLAIDRSDDKKYPGSVDTATGRFVIEGLPVGKSFDVIFDLGRTRLEGISLKVPRSDFEEEQPLTREDVETVTKTARSLNKFEDEVDVVSVTGNCQHAAVLLNKRRTKPFYGSKPGEIVWRLELWKFEKPEETWVKVQDELFLVLYRERLQRADYDKKALTLDPTLGGVGVSADRPRADLGKVVLPTREPGIRLRQAKGGRG